MTIDGVQRALKCYANTLTELPIAKAPSISVMRLLKPLIESDASQACDFIAQRIKDWRKAIRGLEESERGTIKDLLEGYIQTSDEETAESARYIATAIDINIDGREKLK